MAAIARPRAGRWSAAMSAMATAEATWREGKERPAVWGASGLTSLKAGEGTLARPGAAGQLAARIDERNGQQHAQRGAGSAGQGEQAHQADVEAGQVAGAEADQPPARRPAARQDVQPAREPSVDAAESVEGPVHRLGGAPQPLAARGARVR